MSYAGYEDRVSKVCINATEVKRIREAAQLTQLYISKVVGVTTDTISRWENNRYPTIRRENALKLAEALEVQLDDILLKPVPDEPDSTIDHKRRSPFVWLVYAIFLLIVIYVAGSFLTQSPPPPVAVTAERQLPVYAAPGSTIPVQIHLTHRAQSGGVILREYFPKGWKIVQAHPPTSSLDNVHGVARWIIKAGDDRDRVVYLVQVDSEAKLESNEGFQGEIVASMEGRQSAVPVQGESSVTVTPVHWVDANADGRIDDAEMLEGSFTIEDMAGVHIDWVDLENLWDAGSYAWDKQKGRFVPDPDRPQIQ